MTPFDLVFILVFLTTVLLLGRIAIAAVRGRRAVATRRVLFLVAGLAGYLIVVLLVGLVTPRREVPLGRPQCSDDWCIAVTHASAAPGGRAERRVDVEFQVSSRARRIAQRERFVTVYLRDTAGHRYDPAQSADQPPFDTLLRPGQSLSTHRIFVVPHDVHDLSVVVTREGDLAFPRCCIIGDGPLHKPPVTPLTL
jgi:hypothetical protein